MYLATNGVIITGAIKFVQINKKRLIFTKKYKGNNNKESKRPDDEDENQLEQKQE